MNYVRTSSGSMMAINTKSSTQIVVKNQKMTAKPIKKPDTKASLNMK
jgi:hypothetical protein